MTLPKGKPTPTERGTRFRRHETMPEGPNERAEVADAAAEMVPDEEIADSFDEPDETDHRAEQRDRPTVTELPVAAEEALLDRPSIIIRQRSTVTDMPDLPVDRVDARANTLRPVAQEWQPSAAARVERPTVMRISEVRPAPPRWGLWIGVAAGVAAVAGGLVVVLLPTTAPVPVRRESPEARPVPPPLVVEPQEPPAPQTPPAPPQPTPPAAPEPVADEPEPAPPAPPPTAALEKRPAAKVAPDEPPPPTAEKPRAWTHVVTGTSADPEAPWLALRDQPSSEAAMLAKLPDGTRIRVVAVDGRWREVVVVGGADGGARGFVHARWLAPK